MEKTIIDAIEKKIGYEFKNKALLIQAFTRESYAKEQRVKGIDCNSNEQLEYFGDSVLNYLVVSGQLDHFTRTNESTGLQVLYKEGKLSEFNSHWTNKKILSNAIEALRLADYLIMSKGDIKQEANKTDSVKEDLFESIVGAMWIDSDKDVFRIQDKVFKMLNIEFNANKIVKNYVSRLIEFSDGRKFPLSKEVNETENGYEVKYTMAIKIKDLPDYTISFTGAGKNIKAAEQDSAKLLVEWLERQGFLKNAYNIPKIEYNIDTAINVLQELNQKGHIGDITYEDKLCFSTEKKPYWEVQCKISNYVMTFTGVHESKKIAKKEAANSALIFIYKMVNTGKYNPAYKQFQFFVNETSDKHEDIKVFIIDNYDSDSLCSGTMFPDDKPFRYFISNDIYFDDNGDWIRIYDNPCEAVAKWYLRNSECVYDDDTVDDCISFLSRWYDELPEEIKTNGVLLREKLIEIVKNY